MILLRTKTLVLMVVLVVSYAPTATGASVVSDLDTLKEVQNALKHARSSVDGLVELVTKFFTSTTEEAPSTTSPSLDTSTTTPYATELTEDTTTPMTLTSLSPPTTTATTSTTTPTTSTTTPTTSTTTPTTSTTTPTTSTTTPTTSTATPITSTTTPITSTTTPTTSTTTPTTSTTTPITSTTTPITSTTTPTTSTTTPTTSTTTPTTSTTTPTTSTTTPTTSTTTPTTSTTTPTTSTATPITSTTTPITSTTTPTTSTTTPTTSTTTPITSTTTPITSTTTPTTSTTTPTTSTTTPTTSTTTHPTSTTTPITSTTTPTTSTTTPTTSTTTPTTSTTTPITSITTPITSTVLSTTKEPSPPSNNESFSSTEAVHFGGVARVLQLGYPTFRRVLRDNTLVDGPRWQGALLPLSASGIHVAVIKQKVESWTATQSNVENVDRLLSAGDETTSNSKDISAISTLTDENTSSTTDENTSSTTYENTSRTTEDHIETSIRSSESPISSSEGPVEPWWDRVNQHLVRMNDLAVQILGGAEDHNHAFHLDNEATTLDNLVAEGWKDPTLVLNVTNDNVHLINTVIDNLANATEYIDEAVHKAKADETEVIVTIVCLSVLFVVVLVSLVVSLVWPASAKCALPKSGSNPKSDGKGTSLAEPTNFPNASFVQHSQLYSDPYRDQTTSV